MVVLSAVINGLLLSPVPLVLLLVAAAVLAGRRFFRVGAALAAAAAALLLLLASGPVRDLLIAPLENRYPSVSLEAPPAFESIVVLGGGTHRQSPDQAGRSALTPESLARLVHGFALHRRTGARLIVSGGVVWNESGAEPEADVARRALLMMGVPENAVLREAESRTTWENARRVSAMLAPGKVIALVTSASHMPRAMLAFRRAGIACLPAPTDYRATRGRRIAADFIPSFDVLSESFRALREYAGLALYAVRR